VPKYPAEYDRMTYAASDGKVNPKS